MDVTNLHYDKRIPNVRLHATAIAMTLECLRIQSVWVQPVPVSETDLPVTGLPPGVTVSVPSGAGK